MINEKKVIPYRIKQARISRGLSMLELSELLGISKQAISQYEIGKNEPSKSVLNNIAFFLKYKVSFFYKPIIANNNASSPIFFRSMKTTKAKEINAAREKIEIFREIDYFLNQYVNFPKSNFPKIYYDGEGIDPISNDEIEKYAKELRDAWELGIGPIENLVNVAQKNGIMISKIGIKTKKIDAFSVWFDNRPFIFANNEKDTNARFRFDIAHELGHLLMHADYYTEEDLNISLIRAKLEDEANRFAGAFLMPKETFASDIYSTSIDHFIQLKAKWKSSIASMIYRCENLNVLSINQIKYLKDQMTSRTYWKTEPLDKEMTSEKPFAHKQAIMLLLEKNIISQFTLSEEIGCFTEEIEEYCFLEKGTLSFKSNSNVINLKDRIG